MFIPMLISIIKGRLIRFMRPVGPEYMDVIPLIVYFLLFGGVFLISFAVGFDLNSTEISWKQVLGWAVLLLLIVDFALFCRRCHKDGRGQDGGDFEGGDHDD
jgi:hypothetical protein